MIIYGDMIIYARRALPTPGRPNTLKACVTADASRPALAQRHSVR
jgi:hypothetical protein